MNTKESSTHQQILITLFEKQKNKLPLASSKPMPHTSVINQFKSRSFSPLYLLHGEEPYFIDLIVDYALDNILAEGERDFNQTVLYAKDTPPINVIDTATRLPMMSEYQVVVVKEAQEYKKASDWEIFEKYFDSPSQATILIFAYKFKKFDGRSKMFKLLKKNGVVFESVAVKEWEMPAWVKNYLKQKKYSITDKALALIVEFIGSDLSRIVNELEKLFILLPEGSEINEKHVEDNIGISKDYNVFELVNAVMEADVVKANKIINYFGNNPKATHITVVLANLLTMYQRLFKAHFLKTADPRRLADELRIQTYPAKLILQHIRKHPAKKISRNFTILREYDMLAKGVGNSGIPDAELMKELVYKLLH